MPLDGSSRSRCSDSPVAAVPGDVLVFGHSHALRSLTARWLELDVTGGRHLVLNTATISVLDWERGSPAVHHWNN